MSRDCTAAVTLRPCYLCAQLGHDGRDCPNAVCWKCNQPGHQSRDCPGVRKLPPWDKRIDVCLRCGRGDCPCAGQGDYARAEGGCTSTYRKTDLQNVRCFSCGKLGHTGCQQPKAELPRPSCFNCGEGGHTADECFKEKPIAVRVERQMTRAGGGRGERNGSRGGWRDGRREERYPDDGRGRHNGGYGARGGPSQGYGGPESYDGYGGYGGSGGRERAREYRGGGAGYGARYEAPRVDDFPRGGGGDGGWRSGGPSRHPSRNSFAPLDEDFTGRGPPGFLERAGKRRRSPEVVPPSLGEGRRGDGGWGNQKGSQNRNKRRR